jgi:transcriptional regulator with XRE-family HTH domain
MPKSIHRPEYDALRALIRELRTGRGLTQTAVSEQLGRTQSFVSDIERGVRRIDALELRDLCQLLDTDLPHFIAELERRLDHQARVVHPKAIPRVAPRRRRT